GNVLLLRGDFDGAVAVLERSFPGEPDDVTARPWPFVASALGAAYTAVGRTAEALPLLERAVERAASMTLMANQPVRIGRVAEAHLAAGRPESALPVAAQALDLAHDHRERGHQAHILRLLGDVWAARDSAGFGRAEDCYRKALALAEQLGMRPVQAQC